MQWYITIIAVVAGLFYVTSVADLHKGLEYAKKHPNPTWSPRIEYAIGMVYYHKEKYGDAQAALTQLLQDYPTCSYAPKALFALADSAEYNHDWETAKQTYAQLIADYPDFEDIALARKRLELVRYQHP